ncbi:MAG: methionyl-tRNA formyltransferase [Phycisphaera sp.]|nr:methionyl-tRNA formyltransferase [Phycisphaera sp.]
MRIVFMGSGEFGLPTLSALCDAHDVRLVITQPDRPAGRKRQMTATPIGAFAEQRGLPLLKPERVNRDEILDAVRAAEPEANVVVAFGQKVGDALIESPTHGRVATMNLHASLLPKYRGAAPINWALIHGETVTGNTVFSLVDRMDAGDILGTQITPVDPLDTAGEVHDRLAAMGPELVLQTLDRLAAGTLTPTPQDEGAATLAPKLSRADGELDFAASAEVVRCRVHGLTPWPGVTTWWATSPTAERHPLLWRRVEALADYRVGAAEPGAVLDEAEGVIATGGGAVRLLEVQPRGKRVMSWTDFVRGRQLERGALFFATDMAT